MPGVRGFLASGQPDQPCAQEREDVIGDHRMHLVSGEVLEFAPAEVLVRATFFVQPRREYGVFDWLASPISLVLCSRLVLIQALKEE